MNDMTAKAIYKKYFAEFAEEPELRTWKPTEWDLKYYNTPKRLAKATEKRNAEFKKEYDSIVSRINGLRACVTKILSCPDRLAQFFAESTAQFVEQMRAKRKELRAKIAEIEQRFEREFKVACKTDDGTPYEMSYTVKSRKCDFMRLWDKRNNRMVERDGSMEWTWTRFDAAFPTEEAKLAFFADCEELKNLKSDMSATEPPSALFWRVTENVGGKKGIVEGIEGVLGGMPENVEFDAHWGVGGHFNGIVSREGKRASFKSFLAGGWNIQKLHIRFRVTLLKN